MKKLSIALINLPLLALGTALAQTPTAVDYDDMLSPAERALSRHPDVHPEWTWMTQGQAALVLKAHGYDFIFNLERAGPFWRGKAMRDGASYHVAINRYAEVFGHMDRKSLIAAAERAQEKAEKPSKILLATLNGPVAASTSRVAPTVLTPARPVATIMGEIAWTWMSERPASHPSFEGQRLHPHRHPQAGRERIWRARAIKDGLVSHVALMSMPMCKLSLQRRRWFGSERLRPTEDSRSSLRHDKCHQRLIARCVMAKP